MPEIKVGIYDVLVKYPLSFNDAVGLEYGFIVEAQDGTICLVVQLSSVFSQEHKKENILIGFHPAGPSCIREHSGYSHFRRLEGEATLVLKGRK